MGGKKGISSLQSSVCLQLHYTTLEPRPSKRGRGLHKDRNSEGQTRRLCHTETCSRSGSYTILLWRNGCLVSIPSATRPWRQRRKGERTEKARAPFHRVTWNAPHWVGPFINPGGGYVAVSRSGRHRGRGARSLLVTRPCLPRRKENK